jgi:cytochrome c553
MRHYVWALALAVLFVPLIGAKPPQQEKASEPPPPWAYGFESAAGQPASAAPAAPAAAPAPDDGTLRRIPASNLAFTLTQLRNTFGPADWYPGDHSQMPEIVAHGRQPAGVWACSLCHYPNGKGRPENAGVSGLPYAYFVQTMADFKNGARKSADSRKANTNLMIAFAKAMTDDEVKAAAEFFGAIKWTPWIKVVETETVPKTRIAGGMFLALEGAAKEPIGQRIIEVPENTQGTEVLRDAHSGFIAYAPVGSIKKGEALVANGGGGKTTQCAVCHGAELLGLGPVPGIAGRSPSYLVRQLSDMQRGSRTGVWTDLMKPVVAKLNNDDMLSIAAYLASRGVAAAPATTESANSLVAQGKARFNAYQCYECHGANGEGTADAPDLVGTHLTAEEIAKFLNKPSADATNKGMPDIPPNSPDLQALVAYVVSLKRSAP